MSDEKKDYEPLGPHILRDDQILTREEAMAKRPGYAWPDEELKRQLREQAKIPTARDWAGAMRLDLADKRARETAEILGRSYEAKVEAALEVGPMKPICKESLDKLATKHIELYESRLGIEGMPWVNTSECTRYLGLWIGILACPSYADLTEEERSEVEDARSDGGYDDLLLPEERP